MMRKSIVIVLAVLGLLACKSREEKAKELVDNYLKETLHDYDSYQSVKWGTLDSAFSNFLSIQEAYDADTRYTYFLDSYKELKDKEDDEYVRLRLEYLDSAGVYLDKLKELEKSFVPEHIGWTIMHKYRAKNLSGAYRLATTYYTFNLSVDSLVESFDLDDKQ